MRALLTVVLTTVLALVTWVLPAQAADLAHGAKVFAANCAACHAGGRNVVVASKSLKKEDLEKYGMDLQAIIYQVTNGKNAMPAFKGRLSPTDIEDVAYYVLDQAEKGW
ncbi:MAG: c-type cytochrome [Gloeomargarita sp. SKYBB_i_bin120]|nr:c-type cytochrome [Gloeomargarita sp. SKYG98]MCS7291981.1 c-type cytochrome [Gloeomargarita sp. SKYB120]MDW8177541.1 c-type cytochrome [Gloeomargarita sp. SKYBB_i_bin120]